MQKVFFLSSLTYECTHVTLSARLLPITVRHACAPISFTGMTRPSGKVRSTRYRGIWGLLFELSVAAEAGNRDQQVQRAAQLVQLAGGSLHLLISIPGLSRCSEPPAS